MSNSPAIVRLSMLILLLAGLSGILVFAWFSKTSEACDCEEDEDVAVFCGTVDPMNDSLNDLPRYRAVANAINADFSPIEGKNLVKANCSSCHRYEKRMVGPALKDLDKRIPNVENWLLGFLGKPDSLIQANDPYLLELYQSYAGIERFHQSKRLKLSRSEVEAITGYLLMLP
jgi:hypothetical protein